MAAVDPQVIVVGLLREVKRVEFVNRETGVVEARGRKLTILTEVGFLEVSAPVAYDRLPFEELVGREFGCVALFREWSFNGRTGTTVLFERMLSQADAAKVAAAVAEPQSVKG